MPNFVLNGKTVSIDVDEQTPLLWVLRDHLGLSGAKFGCGAAQCGSCTVLLDKTPIRSCVMPLAAVIGKNITTIEGLNGEHVIQRAWEEHQVPQCGYCQPGQIMSALGLLEAYENPSDEQIKQYMSGNICRCGTYPRILKAIKSVSQTEFYDAMADQSEAAS